MAAADNCRKHLSDSSQPFIESCMMSGYVLHTRHRGVKNTYRYGFCMVLLDLDEMATSSLFRDRWYFSINKPNLLSFHRKDYLGDPNESLKTSVLKLVAAECRTESDPNPANAVGKVLVLTVPSCLGFQFAPLTIFYCMSAIDPSKCEFIVLDVCNLPWKDRHYYVLKTSECQADGSSIESTMLEAQFVKKMHVSPFFKTDGAYRVRLNHPGNFHHRKTLRTIIALHDAKVPARSPPDEPTASMSASVTPRFLPPDAPMTSKNATHNVLGDRLLTALLDLKRAPLRCENGTPNHCLPLLCSMVGMTWKAYVLIHFQTAKTIWRGESITPVVHFTCATALKATVFHVRNTAKVATFILFGVFLILLLRLVEVAVAHRAALATTSILCVAANIM